MVRFICCLLLLSVTGNFAQSPANRADASLEPWHGRWIAAPGTQPEAYGVYLFRKGFELATVPASFPIKVSADNRYKLFVNGRLVSTGPARGDLYHWNYESLDIAPYLQSGKNALAALVWNEGEFRPEAQMTFQTGFVLDGASENSAFISSDKSWKCLRQEGYAPVPVHVNAYYVAGAGESVDMQKIVSGWTLPAFDDSRWAQADVLAQGLPKGVFRFDYRWMLVPSGIPQMEITRESFASVRRSTGATIPSGFPAKAVPVTVPANTRAIILLDQSRLTNAYVTLNWSGGRGAKVKLIYTESLVDKDGAKGDRNAVEGKTVAGREDHLLSSGEPSQSWTSLWWRTFRYVEMTIETGSEPMVVNEIFSEFTGYPFVRTSTFQGGGPSVGKILDIGWHTARLCAAETYMDCPYYEQLQYIGDTRIQALVTYYNSSDRRLPRQAINLMEQSQISEGLTLSRHPSYTPQIIPTFSLWYIHMLEDFRLYNDDEEFVRNKLINTRPTLRWFRNYLDAEGAIRHLPYWVFTDWVDMPGWNSGTAPVGADGRSAVVDIQLYWTLLIAARLERDLGSAEVAQDYEALAFRMGRNIRKVYWSDDRNMFADRPERDLYSQHVNALAILSGLVSGVEATSLAQRIIADGNGLAPASIYYKYYLHLACIKAGLGASYFSWLGKWEENIRLGLTTWAEMSDVPRSRSDCHAWGASPNIEVFRSVLGIESASPGFRKVRIRPVLDGLQGPVSGSIPHPQGTLSVTCKSVSVKKQPRKWEVVVEMPSGTSGELLWGAAIHPLREGRNSFVF